MSPLTLVFPADRPGSATYAALAAQVEAGMACVIQDRRADPGRRESRRGYTGGRRVTWRRQAKPLPAPVRLVVTP
ncbi:MAG: hypothetical protein Q8R92_05555 [Deltaproteobacteria bacterium]|nr:hypothetical protein [Deltaproteobacteria bacterium]